MEKIILTLPEELLIDLDTYRKTHTTYVSRSEFVRDIIRDALKRKKHQTD